MPDILISRDGRELGSFTVAEVLKLIDEGRLVATDLAWREEMTEWEPLASLPEFTGTFAPPPREESWEKVASSPASARSKMRGFRLAAVVLDFFVLVVVVLPLTLVSPVWGANIGYIAWVTLQSILLTKRGQTVGKWLQGIKIVDRNTGGLVGFKRAVFVRWWLIYVLPITVLNVLPPLAAGFGLWGLSLAISLLVSVVQAVVGVFAFIDILFIFSGDQRCIHDMMAKTVVVQTGERGKREKISYGAVIAVFLIGLLVWLASIFSLIGLPSVFQSNRAEQSSSSQFGHVQELVGESSSRSKITKVTNNARQVFMALKLYATDNDGNYPEEFGQLFTEQIIDSSYVFEAPEGIEGIQAGDPMFRYMMPSGLEDAPDYVPLLMSVVPVGGEWIIAFNNGSVSSESQERWLLQAASHRAEGREAEAAAIEAIFDGSPPQANRAPAESIPLLEASAGEEPEYEGGFVIIEPEVGPEGDGGDRRSPPESGRASFRIDFRDEAALAAATADGLLEGVGIDRSQDVLLVKDAPSLLAWLYLDPEGTTRAEIAGVIWGRPSVIDVTDDSNGGTRFVRIDYRSLAELEATSVEDIMEGISYEGEVIFEKDEWSLLARLIFQSGGEEPDGDIESIRSLSAVKSARYDFGFRIRPRGDGGQLEERLSLWKREIERDPSEAYVALQLGVAQLWLGREDDYGATSAGLLDWAIGESGSYAAAERGSKLASLRPQRDPAVAEKVLALAKRSVRLAAGDPGRLGWSNLALGMAEYRSGNFQEADETLQSAVVNPDEIDIDVIEAASIYRAMAVFAGGDRTNGERLFREAEKEMRKMLVGAVNPFVSGVSHDYLITRLAYREAAEVLGGSPALMNRGVASVLVPSDSTWLWWHSVEGIDPARSDPDFHTTFAGIDYDDSDWQTGRDSGHPSLGFGYEEEWFKGVDIGRPAVRGSGKTAYFRCHFSTERAHSNLELRCRRDDGVIVYIDGNEVGRDNMQEGEEDYTLPALQPVGEEGEMSMFQIRIGKDLAPGEHVLAISLHNPTGPSSDLRIGGITLVEVETGGE